ncbi:MAG: hypothetical protein ACUVTL_11080 [Thermoproteota archaeon]
MEITIIASYAPTVLAILNVFLIVVYLFSGSIPAWLIIWQAIWGTLVAIVLTIISKGGK